jgi:hypothetical protein
VESVGEGVTSVKPGEAKQAAAAAGIAAAAISSSGGCMAIQQVHLASLLQAAV